MLNDEIEKEEKQSAEMENMLAELKKIVKL